MDDLDSSEYTPSDIKFLFFSLKLASELPSQYQLFAWQTGNFRTLIAAVRVGGWHEVPSHLHWHARNFVYGEMTYVQSGGPKGLSLQ